MYIQTVALQPLRRVTMSSDTPANPVSYQYAFLGLLPLALNAMTQPCILDPPLSQTSLMFPAHSSPFLCISSTIDVFFEILLSVIFDETNIREAARHSCIRRTRYRLLRNSDGEVEIEKSAAEEYPKTFAMLGIVSLLQFVKIIGMQGVPQTQFIAGCYFFSYLFLSAVLIIGSSGKERSSLPMTLVEWREQKGRNEDSVRFACAAAGISEASIVIKFMVLSSMLIFLSCIPRLISVDPVSKEGYWTFFSQAGGSLVIYIGVWYKTLDLAEWCFKRVDWLADFEVQFSKSSMKMMVFAWFNLLFGFLYYRECYDSTGTVKPAWTDSLGWNNGI